MELNSPPYWITIVLAIVAWLFTTTVDQILKTPYLVYEVVQDNSPTGDDVVKATISLINITDDKAYQSVPLRFLIEDPGEFKAAVVVPYQPAWEGDIEPKPTGHTFQHTLPIIQPGGRFDLVLTHTCSKCAMHITLLSKDNVIVLTRWDYRTFIADHHVIISIAAIIILLLFLIITVLTQSGRRTSKLG